jgi:hypothetical protein
MNHLDIYKVASDRDKNLNFQEADHLDNELIKIAQNLSVPGAVVTSPSEMFFGGANSQYGFSQLPGASIQGKGAKRPDLFFHKPGSDSRFRINPATGREYSYDEIKVLQERELMNQQTRNPQYEQAFENQWNNYYQTLIQQGATPDMLQNVLYHWGEKLAAKVKTGMTPAQFFSQYGIINPQLRTSLMNLLQQESLLKN